MSSHSETTKPLSQDEIAEVERELGLAQARPDSPYDRGFAYYSGGAAGYRLITAQPEQTLRLLATIRSRDERIRATIPKLDGIIAATDTMGADYGIPTVARLAREAKRTLTEADNG